ncbi:MAG TPA: TetR/AcrR family transcriptional regulator [Oscillospiraceae bacterium]|nr:TetR/AcrR family transcriptional regulator [Oscillospiraceae bacterium]
MPPKVSITKDMILSAAFELVREDGFENLTSRKLAKRLNCSIQPIFHTYKNMDALKEDLLEVSNEYFGNYLQSSISSDNALLSIGLAYIDFAKNESKLFKLLFLSGNIDVKNLADLVSAQEHSFILQNISEVEELNDKAKLFLSSWIYIHGIACIVVANPVSFSREEILELLQQYKKNQAH